MFVKQAWYRWLPGALLPLCMLVGASSDFHEPQILKCQGQVERQFAQGQEGDAETLLVKLIDSYPCAQTVGPAEHTVVFLQWCRDPVDDMDHVKGLASDRRAFNRHQRAYPGCPADSDSKDQAKITSQGIKAWLCLTAGGRGFHGGYLSAEQGWDNHGDGTFQGLLPFKRAQVPAEREVHLVESGRKGNLVTLVLRS